MQISKLRAVIRPTIAGQTDIPVPLRQDPAGP
jgi:hypothetical protein